MPVINSTTNISILPPTQGCQAGCQGAETNIVDPVWHPSRRPTIVIHTSNKDLLLRSRSVVWDLALLQQLCTDYYTIVSLPNPLINPVGRNMCSHIQYPQANKAHHMSPSLVPDTGWSPGHQRAPGTGRTGFPFLLTRRIRPPHFLGPLHRRHRRDDRS